LWEDRNNQYRRNDYSDRCFYRQGVYIDKGIYTGLGAYTDLYLYGHPGKQCLDRQRGSAERGATQTRRQL
jgi:hypothetical protein